MQATTNLDQHVPSSKITTADLTDLAQGMRAMAAALRRFAERANDSESYSEGVSEETRRELESEFFSTRRGR